MEKYRLAEEYESCGHDGTAVWDKLASDWAGAEDLMDRRKGVGSLHVGHSVIHRQRKK